MLALHVREGICNHPLPSRKRMRCGNPEHPRKPDFTVPDKFSLKVTVPDAGAGSALWLRPASARWLLVLAHGAGARMRHPFLEKLAAELAAVDVATFRYQFPYMEQRRRVPDSPAVLTSTVRAAVRAAAETAPDLPTLAGGKSMGGRMTSHAAAEHPPEFENVRGVVFFGFPLHPPGRPRTNRPANLTELITPMLFLQGTRDH